MIWTPRDQVMGALDASHPHVRWQHTVDQLSKYVAPPKLTKYMPPRACVGRMCKRATVGIG